MITLALAWKVRLVRRTTVTTGLPFEHYPTFLYQFLRTGGRWVDWIQMEG